MKIFFGFIWIIFLLITTQVNSDDLYSSVADLSSVFDIKTNYLKIIRNYLTHSIRILGFLKRHLHFFKEHSKTFTNDTGEKPHTGEQFKSFKFLTVYGRFSVLKITVLANFNGTYFSNQLRDSRENTKSPSETDLEGIMSGIKRLQDVYNYSAHELANGYAFKIQNSAKLFSSDCFKVGSFYYNENVFKRAEEWLQEAYDRFNSKDHNSLVSPVDLNEVLDYLSFSKYARGTIDGVENAIKLLKKAVEVTPDSKHFRRNLNVFERKLKKLQNAVEDDDGDAEDEEIDYKKEHDNYLLGCRGELNKTPEEMKNLYCKYQRENHAFLKLAPVKVEILNWAPYVAIFHDMIYDSEIKILKNLSSLILSRSHIWNPSRTSGIYSMHRVSKQTWLSDNSHQLLPVLNQRISDMTGLSLETAEGLQVMNYGIGGHYGVHHDYFVEYEDMANTEDYGEEDGNRIATVLIYMSDVEEGGATVFPHLKTTIYPKKGTATFWHNLYANGRGDHRTRHAGCPIIFGSKWVSNKWIRSRGQEFKSPCKLTRKDH